MAFAESLGLFYAEQGNGEPVLLLHGFGLTHELWQEQAPLADEFRLVAYDARGCGASVAPQTGYDIPDHAGDLLGLLDHLGLDSAHLVGHSRAGAVLVAVALDHPERVRSLFFVDSVLRGFPWSSEFTAQVRSAAQVARQRGVAAALEEVWLQAGIFAWIRERRPDVFEKVAAMTRRYSGAEWLDSACYPEQRTPDVERLNEVERPTFVLSGQEDTQDFIQIANMLAWWIPGARQKSLLGVGHFPMLENPHETNLYLRGFLRMVVARS
ncbi:MAG: alpha/beta hydrolase [Thermoleophilia bacterium]|nr:alpha/beta hydrolase [Thermoleophilia bacterium]